METVVLVLIASCALVLVGINAVVLLGATTINIQSYHIPDMQYSYDGNNFCIQADYVVPTTGSSMRPRFFTGNLVMWKDWSGNKDELKEGMVVWVEDENRFFAHTIHSLYTDYIITWGDNNLTPDEHIPYSSIRKIALGVVYT